MTGPVIGGYAALFDAPATIGGAFEEVIRPGAFDTALRRGGDCKALLNHEPSRVLASTRTGTLRLESDARGLRYAAEVNTADPLAVSALELVSKGLVRQSSFSFSVKRDRWSMPAGAALPRREILEVGELYDVSPVTYPAYASTSAYVLAAPRAAQPAKVVRRAQTPARAAGPSPANAARRRALAERERQLAALRRSARR